MEERWPFAIAMTMQRHSGSRCAESRVSGGRCQSYFQTGIQA
jgi:hypothetical protein